MRRFRAQRNFYIAGFALFLCLVIKRLVGLISANAGLQVYIFIVSLWNEILTLG